MEDPFAPSDEWQRIDPRSSNPPPPEASELDKQIEQVRQIWHSHSIDPFRSPRSSFAPETSTSESEKEPRKEHSAEHSKKPSEKPPSSKKLPIKQPPPPPPLATLLLYGSSASESSPLSVRRSVDSPLSDSSVREAYH